MVKVKFYGDLKRFADKPLALNVSSFSELMSGLLTQIQGLRNHLRNGYYKVRIGRTYLNEDRIKTDPIALNDDCTVHITPLIAGAGKAGGVISAIAGMVLVVVGAVTQQWYLAGYGAGLLLGGAMMLTAKVPTMTNETDDNGKLQSTSFSNVRNLTPQGRPIPLLYGKMMTSLILISQGIETFDDMAELVNTTSVSI